MPTANTNYIEDVIEIHDKVSAGFKYVTDVLEISTLNLGSGIYFLMLHKDGEVVGKGSGKGA